VSAESLTKNGRVAPAPVPVTAPPPEDELRPPEDELRHWARRHVERVRHLKKSVAYYVLGMLVLTPIWALVQWQDNGAFERFSTHSNPGDWEPWIFYVALIWGLVVSIDAVKVYFDRPTTEAEVDRAIERLVARR
jgi:hypothetical protein